MKQCVQADNDAELAIPPYASRSVTAGKATTMFTPTAAAGNAGGESSGAATTLPNTGAGDTLTVVLLGLGLLALAGGMFIRRRTA